MSIVFTNNSSTTLASAILYTDVSFTVATGTGSTFPAISGGDVAYITLTNGSTLEIVKVTGRSGDIFTCVRGQDGTTAVPWAAGTTVQLRTTAAALTGMMQKANNLSDLANAGNARTNLGVAIGSNVQAWDADLDAIAALTGTAGYLRKTATNTWTLDVIAGTVTSINISGGTTGLTTTGGPITASGTITLGGTLGVANGGTGLTSYTANGVLYASASGTLATGSALTYDGSSNLNYGISNAGSYNTVNVNNLSSTGYARMLFNIGSGGANGVGSVKYAPGIFFAIGTDADSSNTPMVFNLGNSAEQMRLTSTGLGIGTSSVQEKLTVAGAGLFQGALAAYRTSSAGIDYFSNTARFWSFGPNTSTAGSMVFNNVSSNGSVSQSLTFDSSGNLGLGVTPPTGDSGKMYFGATKGIYTTGEGMNVYSNAYLSGGYKYASAGFATGYYQYAGQHVWQTAPSGAANGVITFTQAMTLDVSGNLTVQGTTNNTTIQVGNSTAGSNIQLQSYVNDGYLNMVGTGSIIFRNGSGYSERARIDSSGNLLVGTTSGGPIYGNEKMVVAGPVSIKTTGSNGYGVWLNSGSATTGTALQIYNGSTPTQVGSISVTATNAAYNTSSDQRLKENIVDAEPSSALIDAIQVRQYDWKSDGSHQRYGFIAQELVTVAPEAVHQPADPEEMMAVDYSKLVPMLVKEIQSLRKRLATLESK